MAISLRRVGEAVKPMKYLLYFPNIPNIVASVFDLHGLSNRQYTGWILAIHPAFEFGYQATCFTLRYYLQALERGINIHGLCYSNIVSSGSRINKHIFEICQLPNSTVGKSRNVMNKDSHANSTLSREKILDALPNLSKPHSGFWNIACAISEEFGVPGPDRYR